MLWSMQLVREKSFSLFNRSGFDFEDGDDHFKDCSSRSVIANCRRKETYSAVRHHSSLPLESAPWLVRCLLPSSMQSPSSTMTDFELWPDSDEQC